MIRFIKEHENKWEDQSPMMTLANPLQILDSNDSFVHLPTSNSALEKQPDWKRFFIIAVPNILPHLIVTEGYTQIFFSNEYLYLIKTAAKNLISWG